jgi:hypothetical protein
VPRDNGSHENTQDPQRGRVKAAYDREMYRLRVVEGFTLAEIAARFDRTPERIRQRINLYVTETRGIPPKPDELSRLAAAARSVRKDQCDVDVGASGVSHLSHPERGRYDRDGPAGVSPRSQSGQRRPGMPTKVRE